MSSFPLFTRVSESLRFGNLAHTLAGSQGRLSRLEADLATGERVRVPSDDPLGATRILALQRTLRRSDVFLRNVDEGIGRLSAADGSLSTIGDLLVRAKEILISQSGDTATADTRAQSTVEIGQILEEMLAAANLTFAGRSLFAGSESDAEPFRIEGQTVVFRGDTQIGSVEVAPGMRVESSVSAYEAFGALSATIGSRADLDPVLARDTMLRDLHGGTGVRLGSIEIRDGAGGLTVVDLSGAETVGDVLDRLNDDGFVEADLDAARTGIRLSRDGADLTVMEVDGGYAANDLGIAGRELGAAFDGSDLDPALRASTRLSLLRDGAGIERTGLVVRNGERTATIDLSEADTVGDLLNAIGTSGAGVRARIGADGRTIEVVSELAGADLRIEDAGGTSASELGLVTPVEEILVDRLNDGFGISTVEGDDFVIDLADGTTVSVDIDGAGTLGEVIEMIGAAGAGKLEAALEGGEARIRIRDLTAGTGALRIRAANGSHTADSLGIAGEGTGGVLSGSDLRPSGARVLGAFQAVLSMRDALQADDPDRLQALQTYLDEASDRLLSARADLGGRLSRLELSRNRIDDEKARIEEIVTELNGVDLAEALVRYQEETTLYQAVLSMASQSLNATLLDYLR
ncbi:MAG: flagellar hook-associated protein FlgL [Planctomycetes bacterium]|nr:flagellar hook-associated protein FlgL [Planctomycetota bacterium]